MWVNDIGTVNTPQGQTTTIGGLSLPAGAFLLDITGEAADDVGGSDEYGMRCDTSTGQHMTDFGGQADNNVAAGAIAIHDVITLAAPTTVTWTCFDYDGSDHVTDAVMTAQAVGTVHYPTRGAPPGVAPLAPLRRNHAHDQTTEPRPARRGCSTRSRARDHRCRPGEHPRRGRRDPRLLQDEPGHAARHRPGAGADCSNGESPLDWSQTGPAGAQGPQGQQGQQGPKGDPGPTYGAGTGIGLTGNAFDILGSYQLPQGCSPGQSPFLLGFPLTHPWGCFNAVGGGQNCFHDNYVTGFGQDGSLNCAAIPDDDPVGPDAYVTRHQESQDTPQNIDTTVGTLSLPAGSFLVDAHGLGENDPTNQGDTLILFCWFGPRAFSWGKPYTTVHGDGVRSRSASPTW